MSDKKKPTKAELIKMVKFLKKRRRRRRKPIKKQIKQKQQVKQSVVVNIGSSKRGSSKQKQKIKQPTILSQPTTFIRPPPAYGTFDSVGNRQNVNPANNDQYQRQLRERAERIRQLEREREEQQRREQQQREQQRKREQEREEAIRQHLQQQQQHHQHQLNQLQEQLRRRLEQQEQQISEAIGRQSQQQINIMRERHQREINRLKNRINELEEEEESEDEDILNLSAQIDEARQTLGAEGVKPQNPENQMIAYEPFQDEIIGQHQTASAVAVGQAEAIPMTELGPDNLGPLSKHQLITLTTRINRALPRTERMTTSRKNRMELETQLYGHQISRDMIS